MIQKQFTEIKNKLERIKKVNPVVGSLDLENKKMGELKETQDS